MQINFNELVFQAQRKDRSACSKLYQLTFKSSYYLALRLIGDEANVAEVVSQSYKQAFENISTLKNPENFETWILHITAKCCIEFAKEKKRIDFNNSVSNFSDRIDEYTEFLPKGIENADKVCSATNKIIDSLSDNQKTVVLLHYYNKMPVTHIAKIIGCSEAVVVNELELARFNIKAKMDKMINRGTQAYPMTGTPIIAAILQKAKEQQCISENLLKTVFNNATKEIFISTAKKENDSIDEPTSSKASKPEKAVPKEKPVKKASGKKVNQKTLLISAMVILLVVALAAVAFLVIPMISPDDNIDETKNVANDAQMLEGLEAFDEVYGKILRDCFELEGSQLQESQFTFAYVDDNDEPDLVFMFHENDEDLANIFLNGNSDKPEHKYLSHTWFGENGSMVELQYHIDKTTQYTDFIAYREYKYIDSQRTNVTTLQYSYNDNSQTEEWLYSHDGKADLLDGEETFNRLVTELLSSYKKIVAGYSVKDFVESDKDIVEFVKKSKPLSYSYRTKIEFALLTIESSSSETTTENSVSVKYKWKESSVLNNSFALIENYNEKSCLVKMADTGYFGLIDLKGNVVVEPKYGQYFDYCSYGNNDTHFIMQDENGNEHIIDMNTFKVDSNIHGGHGANEDIIPAGFSDIDRYHNGLAAAKKNGKWGYVDKNKKVVIPFEYDQVEDRFIADDCRGYDGAYIPVKKNGKMGIINKQNQVVVPFEFSVIMHGDDNVFIAQKNGKWGFIGIGVEPTEPKKPVSVKNTPEWETNYLKTINHEAFEYFNFILTDLDKNNVPDLILVQHNGSSGVRGTICMNGEFADSYSDGEFDYIYYSKSGKLATSSFYNYFENDFDTGKSYRIFDECFCYSYFENGGFRNTEYVHRVTTYDRDTDKVVNIKYYTTDKNYNEVEISESEFNRVYNDVTNNYTKAYETSVEDFKASGKDLDSYMQNF